MQYTFLGRTGVKISRLCLGCMSYGDAALDRRSAAAKRGEKVPPNPSAIRHLNCSLSR
jgi:aryl-alcohol dehydrogenase-like predicted oxidoreductase